MCSAASPDWEHTLHIHPKPCAVLTVLHPALLPPQHLWVPIPSLPSAQAPGAAIWSTARNPKENLPCQEEGQGEPGDAGRFRVGELGAQLMGRSWEGQCGEQQEIWAHRAKAAAGLKASQADGKARNKEKATGMVKGGRRDHGTAPGTGEPVPPALWAHPAVFFLFHQL